MTKDELVKFLEPFFDDIKILVVNEQGHISPIVHISYEVERKPIYFGNMETLEAGEGHVKLVS